MSKDSFRGLKGNLVRYGIESVYDVLKEDVTRVPGFGAVRSAKLVAWAKEVEKGFRFAPGLAVGEAGLERPLPAAQGVLEVEDGGGGGAAADGVAGAGVWLPATQSAVEMAPPPVVLE